jgi:CRP/FNR family cyclic AMP-dependent transcriptional regulator
MLLDNGAASPVNGHGLTMIDIERDLKHFRRVSLATGDTLIAQGEQTDSLYFLRKGAVKVTKDGYEVAIIRDKGAVFGEMSILLQYKHTASVQCLEDSEFYFIEHPRAYLEAHPGLIWHIAQILGMRLFHLNQYLVDVKRQYEGHDHLHMVDEVLETLLNQQKTRIVRRSDSKRDTGEY